VEFETPAGPHAARQVDGRQKTASMSMTVTAELRVAVNREEVEPVPERLERAAGARRIEVEGGRKSGYWCGRNDIGHDFTAADPFAKMGDVQTGYVNTPI
jgi:hypothetical protein